MAIYGRRKPTRPPGWHPKPKRVPSYTRPDLWERLDYVRFADRGWSARKIARRFGRDHHTVLRALEPRRVERLAMALGYRGLERLAIDLATQIGDPALLARMRTALGFAHDRQRRFAATIRPLMDAL